MRFNDAPVQGYEMDVGTRTTIRVVNSQVINKPEFNFTIASIFQNVTIAAWDSGRYNGTLSDWLTTSDYDIFTNYKFYRKQNPRSRAYLINPRSIWRLWQSLQLFAGQSPIRRNPPTSGFIGLALLLPYCPLINFIEFIPSTRLNGRCHYYRKEVEIIDMSLSMLFPKRRLLTTDACSSSTHRKLNTKYFLTFGIHAPK